MKFSQVLRSSAFPCCVASLLFATVARGDSISYTGNLRTGATVTGCGAGCTLGTGSSDADYAQFAAVVYSFNLGQTSSVQAVTFGYGGGTNAAGSVIAQGGFESYLSLFDASGNFLASTFSGTTCPAGAKTNTVSGQCYDVLLDAGTLAAGSYQIAISAYENMSYAENLGTGTLADGFTGLGNLAIGEDLHYAFDLNISPSSSTPISPTPEPPTAMLAGTALAILACGFVWRQRSVSEEAAF